PDCRRAMPWDRALWDMKTLERIRALAALRSERRALREGAFLPLVAPGALAFARTTDDPRETLVVVVNAGPSRIEPRVFVPRTELFDSIPLVDPTSGRGTKMTGGAFRLALEAGEGVVLVPEPRQPGGYDFMKRVEGL